MKKLKFQNLNTRKIKNSFLLFSSFVFRIFDLSRVSDLIFRICSSVKPQRGFTLLLAVLVSSVLLALGLAIFNIVSKEVTLSSSGRESQFAFYAADSGVECALYSDYKQNAFSTSSPLQPECAGAVVENYSVVEDAGVYSTQFSFSLGSALVDPCVYVTVVRETNPTRTVIQSAGYNTCVTTNPRRIERAIRVQY